jgi:hypothetical protein
MGSSYLEEYWSEGVSNEAGDGDNEAAGVAIDLFRIYQDKDYVETTNWDDLYNPAEYMYKNQNVFVNQKAMVCVDGILCEYLRKLPDSPNYGSLFKNGEALYTNGQVGDIYHGKDYSVVIPIFNFEQEVNMGMSWEQFMSGKKMGSDLNDEVIFQNLMDDLINSDEYNALLKNCFLPQVMIHFNAITGVTSSDLHYYDRFKQTKNILLTSMQNIVAAKGA